MWNATLDFKHEANLDEGNMWPVAFALNGFDCLTKRRRLPRS